LTAIIGIRLGFPKASTLKVTDESRVKTPLIMSLVQRIATRASELFLSPPYEKSTKHELREESVVLFKKARIALRKAWVKLP